jgi:hypothetical protein
MQPRKLVPAALLLAVAVSLTRALIVHSGVGPIEYVAGAALVGLLLLTAVRASVEAVRRA